MFAAMLPLLSGPEKSGEARLKIHHGSLESAASHNATVLVVFRGAVPLSSGTLKPKELTGVETLVVLAVLVMEVDTQLLVGTAVNERAT